MKDIFMDFAIASALILVGQLIRSKIKAVQEFFVPASLVAGIVGLILGSYGLNILKFSDYASSYADILIVVVFTAVGVQGFQFEKGAKNELGRMMGFLSYRFWSHCIQVAIPVLISVILISRLVPETSDAFGFILISGFCGGHGTAAAVGEALGQLGFADVMDLCMTSATVGILTGVFAIGFVLLRIVDPQNKSKTFSDTAITTPFTTILEIFTWSFCPMMLMAGQVWVVIGLFGAIAIACLVYSRTSGQWFTMFRVGRGSFDSEA